MKKILATKLLPVAISLTSTSVMAHSGHLSNESLHSFLHTEHIIALAAIGIIAFVIALLRNK